MKYFLDLFTPETWQNFRQTGSEVTGFRERQRGLAQKVNPGDIFLCYLTRLSRWCGVLEVKSGPYRDDTPIHSDPDPFVVRFMVDPIVALEPELAIPIHEGRIWSKLTITRQYEPGYPYWSGFFRSSLKEMETDDGNFLAEQLNKQQIDRNRYTLDEKDIRQLSSIQKIRTLDRVVEVEVPEQEPLEDVLISSPNEDISTSDTDGRQSILMQAKVAQIGSQMGFHIWVPKSDRSRVLQHVPERIHPSFLDDLPLNYNDTTLRTIEQIDVLWLKGRAMARAFEIEHTTAIYSGLLRMADLLALQPNMAINLHIVAPDSRREQVLREIRRPVFSLLEKGPLYEQCSFLSYDAVDSLNETKYLVHMSDTIIAEYEESAVV